MKKAILTLFIITTFICAFSQHSIQYDKEEGIGQIEQQHKEAWQGLESIEGFRIQIAAASGANSKNTIQRTHDEFSAHYPSIPAYITYAEPYFRLRVGNFRTRLEAAAALEQVKASYPGAYIIKDEIKFK